MAAINTNAEETTTSKKSPTHFINVNVNAGGRLIKLGAIPIFENADKAQRTLLDMVAKGQDVRKLDIIIDVRANVKSTDTYESDDWTMVDRQFEETEA
jgi:hypothetical protein